MTEQIFLTIFVQKLWCYELNEVDPILVQRLYLGQTLINQTKLGMLHQHQIWGPLPKLGIAPPMGVRYQNLIFAYNFWIVIRKLKYLCLWIPCVCRIRRCQLCQDWLNPLSAILKFVIHFHIFWTIWHITKIGRDHQHHVRRYHRSMKTAPPTVREILRSLKKTLITFENFV